MTMRIPGEASLVLEPVTDANLDGYRALDQQLRTKGWHRKNALSSTPNPGTLYFAAQVQGVTVGRASITPVNPQPLSGHIGCAVHPAFRGRGYGTAILRKCIALLRAGGITDIQLTVREDNAASIAMIERCGGRLTGIIPGTHLRQYIIPAEHPESGKDQQK